MGDGVAVGSGVAVGRSVGVGSGFDEPPQAAKTKMEIPVIKATINLLLGQII